LKVERIRVQDRDIRRSGLLPELAVDLRELTSGDAGWSEYLLLLRFAPEELLAVRD
jgi:hypothetical protein